MHTRPAIHPSPQQLAAFAAGTLPEAEARFVGRHIDACADCRRAAAAGAARPDGPVEVPPGPELPASLFDHPKFRVLRPLGQGGMGSVFLAEHKVMERPVAIKVISRALLDDTDAPRRFFAEVRAAAKLSHPNIVTAYDAEPAGDSHLFVMEYVEGVNLAQYLARHGPLPVSAACRFVRQAALALQHAHEQGMVHRDIKPANLMLTPKGQVKVLDFGLARLARERTERNGQTAMGTFLGTPSYVAPEQATDARTADIRADVYSLGCTLYTLLAGRPPFQEETVVLLVLAHLEKQAPLLRSLRPDVTEALEGVVARMLAKEPQDRFQAPGEVARALVPFCKANTGGNGVGVNRAAVQLATVARPQALPTPPPLIARRVGAATQLGGRFSSQSVPEMRDADLGRQSLGMRRRSTKGRSLWLPGVLVAVGIVGLMAIVLVTTCLVVPRRAAPSAGPLAAERTPGRDTAEVPHESPAPAETSRAVPAPPPTLPAVPRSAPTRPEIMRPPAQAPPAPPAPKEPDKPLLPSPPGLSGPPNGLSFPGEVDCAAKTAELRLNREFDPARTWVLSFEVFIPDHALGQRLIFIWGDDRNGHDPLYIRQKGPVLEAGVGDAASPDDRRQVLLALLKDHPVRTWVEVTFCYVAGTNKLELYLDGKLAAEGTSVVPCRADRPMPVMVGAGLVRGNSNFQRFKGKVRNVQLGNP
jgi:hypothetical protein